MDEAQCSGMYGKKSWGGDVDPFILLKVDKVEEKEENPLMSLAIFEWKDENLIGQYLPSDKDQVFSTYCSGCGGDAVDVSWKLTDIGSIQVEKKNICDKQAVEAKLCGKDDVGSFVLMPNATSEAKSTLVSMAISLKDPKPIKYPVEHTGFYCVSTYAYTRTEYKGIITFRNAYGELQAPQIPKLPFYGGLTIVYALMGVYVYDICPVYLLIIMLTRLGSGDSYTRDIVMISVSLFTSF